MFTNKVDAASFCWKRKRVTLIKRVKLIREFKEALEGPAFIISWSQWSQNGELIVTSFMDDIKF